VGVLGHSGANESPLINKGESGTCANMPGPGGSRKGIKNRRTLYKEYRERTAALIKINGADFVGESLNAMGEALGFFLQMARNAETPEEARMYYEDALNAGEKLAPFRYAKLASVRVGVERNDVLARDDVTSDEILAELIAEIRTADRLPEQVKAYLERSNGATNGANNGAGGNGANGGGVATPTFRYADRRVNNAEIALNGNAKKPS
jgi:hypothetical protein